MLQVAGIVLCGGRSRRMGQPKAWLPFGEELMLPRIVRLVGEAVGPVVVVASPNQMLPPLPEEARIARDREKYRGPLQGLAAGLEALPEGVDAVYLSSCDVPFLRPAFVRRLIHLLGNNCICVPKVNGLYQPLATVYRRTVLPTVIHLLSEDRLRPVFLFEALQTRVVEVEELLDVDPDLASLRNLNTPEDYTAALREHAPN